MRRGRGASRQHLVPGVPGRRRRKNQDPERASAPLHDGEGGGFDSCHGHARHEPFLGARHERVRHAACVARPAGHGHEVPADAARGRHPLHRRAARPHLPLGPGEQSDAGSTVSFCGGRSPYVRSSRAHCCASPGPATTGSASTSTSAAAAAATATAYVSAAPAASSTRVRAAATAAASAIVLSACSTTGGLRASAAAIPSPPTARPYSHLSTPDHCTHGCVRASSGGIPASSATHTSSATRARSASAASSATHGAPGSACSTCGIPAAELPTSVSGGPGADAPVRADSSTTLATWSGGSCRTATTSPTGAGSRSSSHGPTRQP
mmetsp:Transcript_10045/g.18898  ORF Transcript_10045/g.18898 Transcript_10045/m.18898 type:complete len:324 (+) Transcript_10045:2299-3270(+)